MDTITLTELTRWLVWLGWILGWFALAFSAKRTYDKERPLSDFFWGAAIWLVIGKFLFL